MSEEEIPTAADILRHGQFDITELAELMQMMDTPGWPVFRKWLKVIQLGLGEAALDPDARTISWESDRHCTDEQLRQRFIGHNRGIKEIRDAFEEHVKFQHDHLADLHKVANSKKDENKP